MWWAFGAAAVAGLLLGLRFRVQVLVALSLLVATACLSIAFLSDAGLAGSLLMTCGGLGALHLGYLGGAMLTVGRQPAEREDLSSQ